MDVHEATCPTCGLTNSVELSAGRLCMECRNEWDPATVDWSTLADATPEAAANVVETILGPPAEVVAAEHAEAVIAEMVGSTVRLEGGQAGTLTEIVDDDRVAVLLGDGRTEIVGWDVIESATPAGQAAPVVLDVPDETAAALASTAIAMAGLILTAGAASIVETDDGPRLAMPAGGWLPDDTDVMPMVEQGAAYAIAALIATYNIDPQQIREMGTKFLSNAETANTNREETQ